MRKEKRKKKKEKYCKIFYLFLKKRILLVFLFSFFIFHFSFVWAEEEKPLRAAQTSVPESLSPSVPNYPLPTTHYPLLTESNLNQPLTQRYIAQYSSAHGIRLLNETLDNANIFLPFIKEEVEKRGLPPELAYLPVIESNFVITARSRSGAVGLWQFMLNSIAPFDMKASDFIDERRDFIKSTRGALSKLEDNYNILGSWELALAAYNVGLGATSNMVRRTGVNDYWELCSLNQFRQETEHFVPKFIAAVYVITNPRKYGLRAWRESFEWTSIPLDRQVSIDIIADEAGIDTNLLRRLNAQWLFGINPDDTASSLRIPLDKKDEVLALLEREDLKLLRYYYHVIRQGDTLWSISRHYGTPLNIIEQHNPGIDSRFLRIGQTVIIPAFGDAPSGSPALPAEDSSGAVSDAGFKGSHTIQKGDTLWSLSRKYGVDVQTLAAANGMNTESILREGSVLKVPIID